MSVTQQVDLFLPGQLNLIGFPLVHASEKKNFTTQ